jgi:hypothetical protein
VLRWPDLLVRACLEWVRIDLPRPGKAEWYSMQVANEVRRAAATNPSELRVCDMVLVPDGDAPAGDAAPAPGEDAAGLDRLKRQAMAALPGSVYTPPPGGGGRPGVIGLG